MVEFNCNSAKQKNWTKNYCCLALLFSCSHGQGRTRASPWKSRGAGAPIGKAHLPPPPSLQQVPIRENKSCPLIFTSCPQRSLQKSHTDVHAKSRPHRENKIVSECRAYRLWLLTIPQAYQGNLRPVRLLVRPREPHSVHTHIVAYRCLSTFNINSL